MVCAFIISVQRNFVSTQKACTNFKCSILLNHILTFTTNEAQRCSHCKQHIYLSFKRLCYRPQRSWGKVIFSQASVILLTGGRAWLLLGGCVWLLPGGHAWLLGGHAWLLPGGACVVAPGGGMHGCSWGGMHC